MKENPQTESTGSRARDRLADVVKEVGVPAATLRSWERRYAWPSPTRSSGGHRRYTREDVRRIKALRNEIIGGRPAREAVEILRDLEGRRNAARLQSLRAAAEAGKVAGVCDELDGARNALGLQQAIEAVVNPALRELEDMFGKDEQDARDVLHEGLHRWLRGHRIDRTGAPLAVLSTTPGPGRWLSLQALAVLLEGAGWACLVVDEDRGLGALGTIVAEHGPAAVIVSCGQATQRPEAVRTLRRLGDSEATLFYSGNCFATARNRRSVPGLYLGTGVIEATRLIHRAYPE